MTPQTEDDLAQIIADADGPLRVQGGNTRLGGVSDAPALGTSGLTGITLYEPGALTLVAQAGTPVEDITWALAAEGQRLAFEPSDLRGLLGTSGTPTIGGVLATNASGPRRVQVGAARDFALGVRFVDGRGQVIRNGGRVMKNVTGYDLVKVMCGSYGTLGVMTEVSLKVLSTPELAAVLLINGLSNQQAIQAMALAMRSPYEVTGAAHAPAGVDGHPVTMLRLEGLEVQVTHRTTALKTLLADFGEIAVETDQTRIAAGWRWVRDVALFHDQPGDVWCLSVAPSDAAGIAARLTADKILFDWAGGRIWALVPEGHDLRADMGAANGHATRIRGKAGAAAPRFHPEPAGVARLTAGIRARFDPRNILNPGLMCS